VLRWEAPLPAAWSLATALVGVHLITALHQWSVGYEGLLGAVFLDRSARFRVAVGGQLDLLVADGQWWRLFTSVLLHGDALHLAVNAVALVVLGRLLEPLIGGVRWLAWFTVGGVVGSLLSQLVGVAQSDGASAGAFALLGAIVVLGRRLRDRLDPDERRLLGPVLVAFLGLNLVLSFALPFVDGVGHLGGLAAGALLGLLAPAGPSSAWRRWVAGLWVGGFIGVCVIGWALA